MHGQTGSLRRSAAMVALEALPAAQRSVVQAEMKAQKRKAGMVGAAAGAAVGAAAIWFFAVKK